MERIERSEDDLYMLYTGGTTGMPKGVMYDMGGLTRGFVMLGLPMLGLAAPTDTSEIGALIAGASQNGSTLVSIPAAPLMHGTGVLAGLVHPPSRRRPRGHAAEPQPRRPRTAAPPSSDTG